MSRLTCSGRWPRERSADQAGFQSCGVRDHGVRIRRRGCCFPYGGTSPRRGSRRGYRHLYREFPSNADPRPWPPRGSQNQRARTTPSMVAGTVVTELYVDEARTARGPRGEFLAILIWRFLTCPTVRRAPRGQGTSPRAQTRSIAAVQTDSMLARTRGTTYVPRRCHVYVWGSPQPTASRPRRVRKSLVQPRVPPGHDWYKLGSRGNSWCDG